MYYLRPLPLLGAVIIGLTGCVNSPTTPEVNNSTTSTEKTNTSQSVSTEDVDYMTALALMRGHMLVAKELLDQGKSDQAEPHIGHPVEELYGEVEKELPTRNVKEFKSTLNQLHDLVKLKPEDSKLTNQYDTSIQAIDGAIKAVPETQRQSPKFILKVINGLLETADEEYKAGIANGKVLEIIEYQDSRGFVIY